MEQNNNNLTVWQRLSQAFGPNSLLNQDYPTYKLDKKELLKTTSKVEYDREKLQAQQTYYLANQWTKIESNLYTQAVYYEPTRLASFYDYESMEYCVFSDTKIATPDGFITIKELADRGRDYEFITYAYDHNLKKVVPAKARNAHYTRDEMTYKITFDDNSHIIATWEHQFMKRDGSFERVMNLKPGDSMMPFYRKSLYNNEKYNWVYTCNSKEGHQGWVAEHNLIAEWFYGTKIKEDEEVHHIDFNGKNNLPENLQIMTINEHKPYHAKLNNEKSWSNPDYTQKMSEVARRNESDNKHIPWDDLLYAAKQNNTLVATANYLGIGISKLESTLQKNGYKNWDIFMGAYGMKKSKAGRKKEVVNDIVNHKIVSIEPYGIVPVYDLTVPGYKNFATDTIFSHNTPEISAALDIYGEESTTVDQNGYMLQIYSESKRIKSILTDLFNNVLDINTNLPMWTRNTAKYGDNFVYLKLDAEKGVVGCMQLPNIEIERLERGMAAKAANVDEPIENKGLRFKWKAKDMEFNSWEIAHFRLLGDDRKLPYGTCLKFDTKIDTEFGVKEIKDIVKGDKVYSFDLQTEKKVLSEVLDTVKSGVKTCYQIHTKHNFVEASVEHKILIFNGVDFVYKNTLDLNIGDLLVIDNSKNNTRQSYSLTFYDSLLEQIKKYDNNKRKSDDYILEPITKILEIGDFETYDIYVENENHNFYANGIVVHNSMLEKARRIWKQLLLSEDAMLIYRTSRAPERRVFKVYVGNMDDKDVESYVQRVANKFKRDQIVDSKSGNVDLRFNQMAVDQDYFIPVRDPVAPNPIDTLPGAQNLAEIADIEYIQKKLLTALRVPKAFLGFEEVVGDGKNLSLQDIRFARTINRIQKSMISELNKIAIIHLFLLGFEDELSNFTLGLTNPSTQADLLKIDVFKEKLLAYKDAVTAIEGIAPVSVTWAKKHILGFSDEEIKLDLQQQRIEKAVGSELTNTATIITHTGVFDNIDKLYGNVTGSTASTGEAPAPGGEEAPSPPLSGGSELPPPPPPGGEATITPESIGKDNLNILLENESLVEGDEFIDLSRGRNSLGKIEDELNKLLND